MGLRRNLGRGQGLVEAKQRRVMASERSKTDTPIARGPHSDIGPQQGIVEQPHGFRRGALLTTEDSKNICGNRKSWGLAFSTSRLESSSASPKRP